MFTWQGLQTVAKPITEITENTADKTISFKFMDGPAPDPVTSLTATVTVNDVKLDWTAPARDDIKGYKIFRDGTLIYSTTNKDLTTYTQVSVPNGTYEYCVSVVFEVNESELVCANATITEGSDGAYFPISNLQASGGVNSVNLNWTAPFTGGWTGIAGDYTTVYTFGEPWDFFAGTLWNPSDLAGLGGFDVTKVKFVPVETIASGASYSVVIYEVPTSGAPVEVYSQAVTSGLSYGAYNEITLTTPLTIDASKGIIIGVQIHTEGGNCLAVSQGDAYPGRNIFYDVDGWYPLEDIGVTLGRNFCLQVYLDADSSSPVILPNPVAPANTSFLKKDGGKQLSAGTQIASGINQAPAAVTLYKIYRDGVQVGTSTTTSYTDAGLTPATAYSYCVSVEYSGGGLSESVCVEVSTQNPYKPVTDLKAEVVIDEVKLTWKPQFSYNTIFAEDFESGIPASWGNVDVDGDGYIWSIAAAPSTTPQSGDKVAYSASYDNDTWEALTPNNWLVTPAITLTDDNVLRYYVSAQDASYAADKYGVYISTDNAVPGTFVSLFEETMTASPGIPVSSPATGAFRSSGPQYAQGTWYERTVDLSAYAGQTVYIAFRHFDCTDQFLVNLDNVQILEPINFGVMTFAVSEEGTTIATGLTNPEYTLTGVTVDTHNYCVTAIYDGIVESEAVCVEAIVISPYRPVTNLEAQVEEDDINLNWGIPEAIAYNTVFEEDFESGIPATWTNVDEDGDGFTWYESLYATPQSGNGSVSSDSYDLIGFTGPLTPDNWLITPAITLSGKNRLSYYISTLETTWPAEKYGVYISTTTTALDQFTELFNETMSGSPAIPVVSSAQKVSYARSAQYVEGTWLERAIDLSAYEGQTVYIAFRHYDCYDQFSLNLDNVKIQESIYIGDITYNVYEDDVLAASGLTTTQYALTDKVPGTYNYCVTAVYDNVNESESVCVEATVLSPYRPVTNLKAQVVVTDVNLKWGEPQSLTNNVVFEEDFESGIPASWSNVDEDGDGYLWSIYSPPVTLSGTQVATSASYQGGVLTPNNWLVTPAITLTDGNVLKYYVNAQDDQYPREKYGVYISTDNTIPGTFVSLFEETMTASPGIPVSSPATGAFRSSGPQYVQGAWYERTIDLSAYNGQTVYIAFRHFDSRDEFRLNLDNVQILEPSSMGDITYNVYEEGTLLASGLTEKQYTVTDVTAGTHNYCVTAVYDNVNESESVCVEATVLNPYRPVHNLNATWTEPFKSELNWDVPVFAQTLRHHTFSSGSFSTVNVTGSNIDIDAAARWTPEDLEGTGADEFMLTKVRFLPVAAKSVVSYSIRIWVGGSNPSAGVYDPGTLIVDQPIPAHTPLTWSEIVLDTPVAIDPTQEIWIGLRCVLPSGGYTAPLQPSNTLAGKGNLIRWNGTWMELTDVNSSIAGNWIIDGILGYQGANAPAQLPALNDDAAQTSGLTLSAVEEALTAAPFVEQAPTLPTVVKYIVTRDGEELGETTATTFADETTVDKTSYTYCVQAVYDDEGISSPACTDFVKTDAQILEEVKIVIEATTNSFYQSTANDESQVANWLVGRLKNINLPSEIDITAGDISFNAFTAAIEGTESVPDGIDGSFDFTVSLTLPEAANTATGSGTILALGYTPPAPEEVYYNLDIPSVEGVSIDWSPGTHSVGDRENITITFAALEGYLLDGMNVYANGTVQSLTLNNGLYVLSLGYLSEDVSITVDGVRKIDDVGALSPSGADLKAMKVDGGLYVYGLKPGADFRVYNISGTLVYQGKAVATEQFVTLHERGFYIVVSEGVSVKIAL
jgi:hypothetical protein